MERVWKRLRSRTARPEGDAGVSLVEMLVALTLMSMIMSGIGYGLTKALWTTRDSGAREAAAQLASQSIDQARASTDIANLAGASWTQDVDGTTFTITRTVTPYLSNGAASPCDGSGNSSVMYKRVSIRVTWPNKAPQTKAVRSDTLLTPSASLFDPSKGNVASKVLDANGKPVEGVLVTITDSTGSASQQYTDESGCAFFDGQDAGAYTATAQATGYVSSAGTTVPSQAASVSAGGTTAIAFSMDVASMLGAHFGSTKYVAPNGVVLQLGNTALLPDGTISVPGTGADRTITNVFPFLSGYYEWAGSCQDADPAGLNGAAAPWHPGATRGAPVSATSTGTPVNILAMANLRVVVLTNSTGIPVAGATPVMTHAGTATCDYPETFTLGASNANGEVFAAVPWGTWSFSVPGRTLSAPVVPVFHPTTSEIYVEVRVS